MTETVLESAYKRAQDTCSTPDAALRKVVKSMTPTNVVSSPSYHRGKLSDLRAITNAYGAGAERARCVACRAYVREACKRASSDLYEVPPPPAAGVPDFFLTLTADEVLPIRWREMDDLEAFMTCFRRSMTWHEVPLEGARFLGPSQPLHEDRAPHARRAPGQRAAHGHALRGASARATRVGKQALHDRSSRDNFGECALTRTPHSLP